MVLERNIMLQLGSIADHLFAFMNVVVWLRLEPALIFYFADSRMKT
jgi:hypothetical protein